uniref:Ig-like domain-containing protein n=1 Tax=Microcebus murinus TaxID=30608 RepID=A0A8C5Y6V8_MICMU
MEPPLGSPSRRRVPWQGLLLTVSLLTFWNPPAAAQLSVESVPLNAVEGKHVLLLAHNVPQDTTGYSWYKGDTVGSSYRIVSYVIDIQESITGPAYSGRETIYPNGSLLFQNVTLKDTGYYMLQIIRKNFDNKEVTGQLRVYLAQPSIHASSSTVTEDKDSVVLTCLTNDTGISIRWIFNNQSLQVTERMQLSQDNISLSINPVERGHAGGYQCEVSNPVSHSKENAPGVPVGAIAGIVIGVLAGVALVAALGCVLFLRRTGRANGQRDLREQQPPKSISGECPSPRSLS